MKAVKQFQLEDANKQPVFTDFGLPTDMQQAAKCMQSGGHIFEDVNAHVKKCPKCGAKMRTLDVAFLIKTALDNTQYQNQGDIRKMSRICDGIETEENLDGYYDHDEILFEDADLDFLKPHVLSYQPFLKGRAFVKFLTAVEEAQEASK